jgi:hypothetical protein
MTPAALPQYFKYDGTEKAEANSSALALPYRFRQPTSPGNDPGMVSGACSFPSGAPDAPPFWFDFSGNRLAGKPKNTLPSEYFVSPVRSGSGLRLVARFGGEAGGSGVLYETAYFHQQYCDAGGLEFGFYRNAVAAQTVFYFSNNSNCGIQPNGYCHVSDSYSSAYQNENNYPGQALTTHVNGWAIQNLNPASKLLYSVFILPDRSAPQGYRFQVEVIDPATSRHADCDAYDTHGYVMFQNKPCSFPVRPGGWYPIDELYNSVSGYVTVGIQRTGNPAVATPADFEVDQVSIPRK